MNNLDVYNKVREVPKEAQKTIGAGRLKGMTDINPMWRIKVLTEVFGMAGVGWYTNITDKWVDEVNNEKIVSVKIDLYVKTESGWSMPIVGIGGSKLAAQESKGVYADDEAFKKAYTDAISVACKALGVGADIYWSSDRTKYSAPNNNERQRSSKDAPNKGARQQLIEYCKQFGYSLQEINSEFSLSGANEARFKEVLNELKNRDGVE